MSNTAAGVGNGPSLSPSISADGRYVAFASAASNLVEGDTNQTTDIFVCDRVTATTVRVSVKGPGGEANGPAPDPPSAATVATWPFPPPPPTS